MRSWRRPGQGNSKDGRQQSTASTPNAWGNKTAQNNKPTGQGQAAPVPAPKEEHVPVRDFNAAEVRDYLKKSECCLYRDTASSFIAKLYLP